MPKRMTIEEQVTEWAITATAEQLEAQIAMLRLAIRFKGGIMKRGRGRPAGSKNKVLSPHDEVVA